MNGGRIRRTMLVLVRAGASRSAPPGARR